MKKPCNHEGLGLYVDAYIATYEHDKDSPLSESIIYYDKNEGKYVIPNSMKKRLARYGFYLKEGK